MKKYVEHNLGFEISDEQFNESKERAEKKRIRIISQFGDCNGKRRQPEYLAELIYEDVIANIFSEITLITTMLNMEKGTRQNAEAPLVTDHIVAQVCE